MKPMNKKKIKNRIIAFVNIASLAFLVVVLISSMVTFGKYYSQQRQKGVAMASDFYFSSDILAKGVKVDRDGPVSGFAEYALTGRWNKNATTSTYTFSIRNFENNLLHNDGNVDVKYNVYFKREGEETTGITSCTISDSDEDKVEVIGTEVGYMQKDGGIKEYSLKGGSANAQTFTVTYKYDKDTDYPTGLYIWVVPTSPSYISSDNYTLGAKMQMTEAVELFSLTGSFDISESLKGTDDETNTILKNQSGFVYKIATTGAYDSDQVPITIEWNTEYLILDKFSSIADEVVETDGKATVKTNIDTFSTMDITFYKKDSFNERDWTKSDFENLVNIKVTGTTE